MIGAGSALLRDFGHCASLSSPDTHLSRCHIVSGRNSSPGIQIGTLIQQVSVPSKLCRYFSNRKCGPIVE